jgi:hypothetical protein
VPTPTTCSTPRGVLPPTYLHIPRLVNIEEYKSFSGLSCTWPRLCYLHSWRSSVFTSVPHSGFIPSHNQTSEFSDYIALLVSLSFVSIHHIFFFCLEIILTLIDRPLSLSLSMFSFSCSMEFDALRGVLLSSATQSLNIIDTRVWLELSS